MDSQTRPRRGRRWAAGLGAATIAVMGLGFAPPAQAHETPLLPPGDYTEEQVRAAEDLVHRTEEVLPARYSDSSVLEGLGFYDFGVAAPGGWHHFINPGWMDDEHLLNPEYPESLVYRQTADGLVLEAAMFYLTSEHSMDNIPEEYAWWPGWHTHEELCVDEGGQFTGIAGPDGTCSVGQVSEGPPMMHVWIVDNECGHRFGGLGVGGLMCDVEGHGGGGHGGGGHGGGGHGHEPDPEEPAPEEPGTPPTSGAPAPEAPSPGGEAPPVARPAQPVVAEPDYTG